MWGLIIYSCLKIISASPPAADPPIPAMEGVSALPLSRESTLIPVVEIVHALNLVYKGNRILLK
jgi:hypothetical protein